MANFKCFFLQIAFFILLLLSFFTPSSAGQVDYKGCFSKVYAFGDSYTDTGNAYFMGSLKSFVGEFFSKFQQNSSLPGYRLSNGRLVIDYLCEALSIPYLQPYKNVSKSVSSSGSFSISGGANFAIAGSSALSFNFFSNFNFGNSLLWKPTPESLQTQIDWFNKFLQEKECVGKDDAACKGEMENALFWIGEMGGNDYLRLFGTPVASNILAEVTVSHVCQVMKTLLDKGAKYLVVQGLPPTGCLPLCLSLSSSTDRDQAGCSASANSVIMAHNDLLQKKLAEIQQQYSQAMIVYADYWSAFQTILANHKNLQFSEPFQACCGASGVAGLNFNLKCLCGADGSSACNDSSKHISWDGIHLTETMHQHLADLFFNQDYCKPSFSELIKKKKGM